MSDFPRPITEINHIEPVPRRIRGNKGGQRIVDTKRALYVWELAHYPHYYIPRNDVRMDLFAALEGDPISTPQGDAQRLSLRVGGIEDRPAARLILASHVNGLPDTVRIEWNALDQWFEEDEEVFVHPRSPYTRVDALRSTRAVRIELDGIVLAESSAPVMVFETGLPTRYYVDASDVHFAHVMPSQTRTACPYKGTTSYYWSANVNGKIYADLAWAYSFPTRQLFPIAGLVAFLNEKVDVFIDGVLESRPKTRLS